MPLLYEDCTGGVLYLLPGKSPHDSVKDCMAQIMAEVDAEVTAIAMATAPHGQALNAGNG
jgi:hypothetical protein